MPGTDVTFDDIREAAVRIQPIAKITPVMRSHGFDAEAKITAETAALVAKFKEMFPEMVKQRVEGGWERLARDNKFTSKSGAELSNSMQACQLAMIMNADDPMIMAHLDHWYAMMLAEFSRRSAKVPGLPLVVST